VHASPSVLIVDRSEETREVLETALKKRGIRTFAASRAQNGAELARSQRPDLIVLDLEVAPAEPDALCSKFEQGWDTDEPAMVLLGTMVNRPSNPSSEIVAKPYHYGPLIRKIEEILGIEWENSQDAA